MWVQPLLRQYSRLPPPRRPPEWCYDEEFDLSQISFKHACFKLTWNLKAGHHASWAMGGRYNEWNKFLSLKFPSFFEPDIDFPRYFFVPSLSDADICFSTRKFKWTEMSLWRLQKWAWRDVKAVGPTWTWNCGSFMGIKWNIRILFLATFLPYCLNDPGEDWEID